MREVSQKDGKAGQAWGRLDKLVVQLAALVTSRVVLRAQRWHTVAAMHQVVLGD